MPFKEVTIRTRAAEIKIDSFKLHARSSTLLRPGVVADGVKLSEFKGRRGRIREGSPLTQMLPSVIDPTDVQLLGLRLIHGA
jgi:hypothetical protein